MQRTLDELDDDDSDSGETTGVELRVKRTIGGVSDNQNGFNNTTVGLQEVLAVESLPSAKRVKRSTLAAGITKVE